MRSERMRCIRLAAYHKSSQLQVRREDLCAKWSDLRRELRRQNPIHLDRRSRNHQNLREYGMQVGDMPNKRQRKGIPFEDDTSSVSFIEEPVVLERVGLFFTHDGNRFDSKTLELCD